MQIALNSGELSLSSCSFLNIKQNRGPMQTAYYFILAETNIVPNLQQIVNKYPQIKGSLNVACSITKTSRGV